MASNRTQPSFIIVRESDGKYHDGSNFIEDGTRAKRYESKQEADDAREGMAGAGAGMRVIKVFG
jgi:hypothetical protein